MINHYLSDIILNVGNVAFPAHKFVLTAHSPVFAAMFQHGLVENQKNAVDIPDIKSNVFESVLQFLYSGDVLGVEPFPDQVLIAVDKYQLDELKSKCEDIMIADFSPLNAFKFLAFSHVHSPGKLKKKSMHYINGNAIKSNLIFTPDWKEFKFYYPQLAIELYEEMFTRI